MISFVTDNGPTSHLGMSFGLSVGLGLMIFRTCQLIGHSVSHCTHCHLGLVWVLSYGSDVWVVSCTCHFGIVTLSVHCCVGTNCFFMACLCDGGKHVVLSSIMLLGL